MAQFIPMENNSDTLRHIMTDEKKKPSVIFTKYSPYTVTDLEHLENSAGKKFDLRPVITLCRCGESRNKPFCDNSHFEEGIHGEKKPEREAYRWKDYRGEKITVHFNRGVCSHDGSCVRLLPSVFNVNRRPWINPDAATVDELVSVIHKCPSGALAYTVDGVLHKSFYSGGPFIKTMPKGPIAVFGDIELKDDQGTKPETGDHYVLCGCGSSKNAPFCSGDHLRKR